MTQNTNTPQYSQSTRPPVRSWPEAAAIFRYWRGEEFSQRQPSHEGLGSRRPA